MRLVSVTLERPDLLDHSGNDVCHLEVRLCLTETCLSTLLASSVPACSWAPLNAQETRVSTQRAQATPPHYVFLPDDEIAT